MIPEKPKKSYLRKCGFRRRTLIKPLEFHFWIPYPSLRTVITRKLETHTQYKAEGVCFPIHPAAELVGWHSSILVDPFFARGLAICYDEISLPDRISNQIQNQHLLLWGFFTHDFNCVCQSTRRATILLRLSSRCDRPRSVYQSRAFSAGFLDPQECPIQTSGGGAIGLNPVPVVPQWLAKDDAG